MKGSYLLFYKKIIIPQNDKLPLPSPASTLYVSTAAFEQLETELWEIGKWRKAVALLLSGLVVRVLRLKSQ